MPPVECRSCKGGRGFTTKSGKWVECKSCQGRGVNPDLWQTNCKECREPLTYKKGNEEPKYCKKCGNKEKTKSCSQHGCGTTFTYKLGWREVPEYCGRCQSKRKQGCTARFCTGSVLWGSSCGKLIWVPQGKSFTLCQECNQREQAQKAKEREKKEAEKTKTLRKKCDGCENIIEYPARWKTIPQFCKKCQQRRIVKREPNQSENDRFDKACGPMGANLTLDEKKRFKPYYHSIPDRLNMLDQDIVELALDWKKENGGGFRRSDSKR